MNPPKNSLAYDAAFAAAGLSLRVDDGTLTGMERVAQAALCVARLESANLIPEGCYDELLDSLASRMDDRHWPGEFATIEMGVREVLDEIEFERYKSKLLTAVSRA